MAVNAVTKPWARAGVLIIPALWLGMIVAISLIEAPLKFQAPGITIPLGLGIGRLVFAALNLVELICLLMLTLSLLSLRRLKAPAVLKPLDWRLYAGIAVVTVLKIAAVRPFLNRRTTMVLAGVDDGGSLWHYAYIGLEGILIVLLVAFIAVQMLPARVQSVSKKQQSFDQVKESVADVQ